MMRPNYILTLSNINYYRNIKCCRHLSVRSFCVRCACAAVCRDRPPAQSHRRVHEPNDTFDISELCLF